MAGRKENAIIGIRIRRLRSGMTKDEAIASTKGYYRKTVAQLQEIWRQETDLDERKKREAARIKAIGDVCPEAIKAIQLQIELARRSLKEAGDFLREAAREAFQTTMEEELKDMASSTGNVHTALYYLDKKINENKKIN